jgi:hypothetical protein
MVSAPVQRRQSMFETRSPNGAADEAAAAVEHTNADAGLQGVRTQERQVTVEAFRAPRDLGPLDRRTAGPSRAVRDRIWTIVISAFAVVLVGSFLTLALPVIRGAGQGAVDQTTSQIVLTVFTSVVGFLGGLFAPSPDRDP